MGARCSVRSFARIHEANLKKQGVLPLTFADPADYEKIRADDTVDITGLADLAPGSQVTVVLHHADGTTDAFAANHTHVGRAHRLVPRRLRPQPPRVEAMNRFVDAMQAAGVTIDVTQYPDGTRTAADAAAAIGCDVAAIVKSLVFVVDGVGPVLALTSGANRVDPARLGATTSAARPRQAKADEARDATGYAIGGTPPFGHPAPVPTVCDPTLLTFAEVWAAAGTPDTVFPLSPDRLLELSGAEVVDVTVG